MGPWSKDSTILLVKASTLAKKSELNYAFNLRLHLPGMVPGIEPGDKVGPGPKPKHNRKLSFPTTTGPDSKTSTHPTAAKSGKEPANIPLGSARLKKGRQMIWRDSIGVNGNKISGKRLAHTFIHVGVKDMTVRSDIGTYGDRGLTFEKFAESAGTSNITKLVGIIADLLPARSACAIVWSTPRHNSLDGIVIANVDIDQELINSPNTTIIAMNPAIAKQVINQMNPPPLVLVRKGLRWISMGTFIHKSVKRTHAQQVHEIAEQREVGSGRGFLTP
jgi:hypothetical protein